MSSFIVKNKDGIIVNVEDCFDCPYVVGPLRNHGEREESYICNKTGKLVTKYDKNAYGVDRSRPFEELHDGKDFPAWCPFIENIEAIKKDLKESLWPDFGHIVREKEKEKDFIDIFE